MKLYYLVFVSTFFLSLPGYAGQKATISRGGLGFLFPDHNSFENFGQSALDKGTSLQFDYGVVPVADAGAKAQYMSPSIAYSSGNFGLGFEMKRAGTSFTDPAQKDDSAGVGLGFAMAKQRLTVGFSGFRSIDATKTSDGTVGGTITWNGNKRVGFTAGLGVNTTVNQQSGDVKSGVFAAGWGINPMTKFEAVARFANLTDTKDYNMGMYLTYGGDTFFFSGGYNYVALDNSSQVRARTGFAFGKFDLSVYVDHTVKTGSQPSYGGAARVTF